MLTVVNYGVREPGLHTVLGAYDPGERPIAVLDLDLVGGKAQWKLYELHYGTRQPHWVDATFDDVERALHGRTEEELARLQLAREQFIELLQGLAPLMEPAAAGAIREAITKL